MYICAFVVLNFSTTTSTTTQLEETTENLLCTQTSKHYKIFKIPERPSFYTEDIS